MDLDPAPLAQIRKVQCHIYPQLMVGNFFFAQVWLHSSHIFWSSPHFEQSSPLRCVQKVCKLMQILNVLRCWCSFLSCIIKSILPSILKATVWLQVTLGKDAPYTSVLTWLNLAGIGYPPFRKSKITGFSLPDGMIVHVRITPTVIQCTLLETSPAGVGKGSFECFLPAFL